MPYGHAGDGTRECACYNGRVTSDETNLVSAIHASGRRLVIAVTGGGSGAISALVQTPGASRSVLEAIVPYSLSALVDWLGGEPDQACSEPTARAMAMASFVRARRLAPDIDPLRLVGVGCTASLSSDRPKRGEHRIHLAVQTAERTLSRSLVLDKRNARRDAEEEIAACVLIAAVAEVCEIDVAVDLQAGASAASTIGDEERATESLTELLLGERGLVLADGFDVPLHAFPGDGGEQISVVFPGAFNPPHAGHVRMAAIAEERLGAAVAWELSIANVDKPPLDFISIRERIAAVRAVDAQRPLVLTRAATFREKAVLFPGATFVVGADTLGRIAESRYYGGEAARRDDAIATIAGQGCRFLAFGRELDGRFRSIGDLALPSALRDLCDGVTPEEFREDVSSKELRRGSLGSGEGEQDAHVS